MSKNNLATKNTTDFTILEDGQAFISRNKTAQLLGVSQQAISTKVSSLYPKIKSNQQLTADILEQLVTYYAFDAGRYTTNCARQVAKQLMQTGAKAYIYHEAGYAFNATPPAPPKLTPLEIAHNALLTTTQALTDEIREREKVEKMLETAKTVELAGCSDNDDISIDEFCKIISSSLENTNLGRTKCYIILRTIGLVETTSTRPTQRGMTLYLDYRKHDFGYSTRVVKDKGSNLIKLMIKTLRDNQSLNNALGKPLGDF